MEIAFSRTPPAPKQIMFSVHTPNNTIENKHTQTRRPSEISIKKWGKPPRKTLTILLGSVRFGIRTLRREPKTFEKRNGFGKNSIAYFYLVKIHRDIEIVRGGKIHEFVSLIVDKK